MPKSTLWRPPDDDLALNLEAAAIATGRPRNAIVTDAIRAYITDPANVDPAALRQARRVLDARPKEGTPR